MSIYRVRGACVNMRVAGGEIMLGLNYSGAVGDLFYSNVVVKQVQKDDGDSTLFLKMLYDDREFIYFLYKDILYTQLDEKSVGLKIIMAYEASPESLNLPNHKLALARLLADCGHTNTNFLQSVAKRGYRILLHIPQQLDTRIVLAKQLLSV